MNKYINEKLAILECVLINEENPSYLEVSFQNGFIYCLLSKPEYMYSTLSERILSVFEILKTFCQDILDEYSIIVETLTSEELSGLFRFYER